MKVEMPRYIGKPFCTAD